MVSILAGFVLCIKKKQKKKLIHDQTIQTFLWLALFLFFFFNLSKYWKHFILLKYFSRIW